jgi:hypothetical protein
MKARKGWLFELELVVTAVAAWALLWWLGFVFIAFAVGFAVLVLGTVAYFGARAGAHDARTAGGGSHRPA